MMKKLFVFAFSTAILFFFFVLFVPNSAKAQFSDCSGSCPPEGQDEYNVDYCSVYDPGEAAGGCVPSGNVCLGGVCYCCRVDIQGECEESFECIQTLDQYCQGYLATCETASGETGNCCDIEYNTFSCTTDYYGLCNPNYDTETCDEDLGYVIDPDLCSEPCDEVIRHPCIRVGRCGDYGGTCRNIACGIGALNLGNIPPCSTGQVCCIPAGNYARVPIYCTEGGDSGTVFSSSERIFTAIGCIPISNTRVFLEFIFPWAFGMGGGVALLLIAYAGFLIITSGGDRNKLQSGKELLTAAIGGLVLIALSVFVFRVFGVDVLGIF